MASSTQDRRLQGKRKRNLKFTGLSAVLIMFSVISFLCSAITVKGAIFGFNLKISLPVLSASPLLEQLQVSSTVKFLISLYTVLVIVSVALAALSVFLLITRKSFGVVGGIIVNILSVIIGAVLIITIFSLNKKYGSEALSITPSLWLWLSLPINFISGIFLLTEKDNIV